MRYVYYVVADDENEILWSDDQVRWCRAKQSEDEFRDVVALEEDRRALRLSARDFERRSLDFATLRRANVERCEQVFHPLDGWSASEWGLALCGEAGEAANFLKKLHRGDPVSLEEIADEIADAVLYADLLAARLGIDLASAVVAKFDRISREKNSTVFLAERSFGLVPKLHPTEIVRPTETDTETDSE